MLVHLGWADTAAVRATFEELSRLRPGSDFNWDPANRVITIMAISALVDENLEEAGAWVAAIEAATSTPERARVVGRPARQAWLAMERGSLANAERFADESLSCAGPELIGGGHALVEVFAVKARLAAERAEVDEADAWAERAVDLAAELGDPCHQAIAREATVAAVEARAGAAEALQRLVQMTAAAPLTSGLRIRHALLAAELERVAAVATRPSRDHGAAARTAASTCCVPHRRGSRTVRSARRSAAGRSDVADEAADRSGAVVSSGEGGRVVPPASRPRARRRRRLRVDVPSGRPDRRGRCQASGVGGPEWRSSRLATVLRDGPGRRPVDDDPLAEPLSEKERQVLQFLPTHLSAIEIARQIFVSVNTLRTHIKAIYRKLDVNTRSQAVRRAETLGLITEEH